jgi:hypothetical protein
LLLIPPIEPLRKLHGKINSLINPKNTRPLILQIHVNPDTLCRTEVEADIV